MKGFIIMLSVFLILNVFVLTEEYYINKTSEELFIDMKPEKIETDLDLNKIVKKWESTEKKLRYFVNHEELDKITLELKTAQSFYINKNETLYIVFLERAKEKIKKLPEY